MKRLKFLTVVLLLNTHLSFAQNNIKGWHLRDPQKDSFYGISLQQTYDFLKGKTYTPIIVAIIDSGIDTTHEDLKKILWTNPAKFRAMAKMMMVMVMLMTFMAGIFSAIKMAAILRKKLMKERVYIIALKTNLIR